MPFHRSLNLRDLQSVVFYFLLCTTPGLDRQAFVRWAQSLFSSQAQFETWGVQLYMKILEWSGIAFFYLLYTVAIPYIERHRVFPHKPWPWNDPDIKVREEYRALQLRAIKYILKFHACVITVNWLLGTYRAPMAGKKAMFLAASVPGPWTSLWQITVLSIVAETGFYWGHRLLHTKAMYGWHKQHHEFKDSTVLATFYVSFVDALITDIIPAGIPAMACEVHIFVIWQYLFAHQLNAMIVHCGYDIYGMLGFSPFTWLPFATEPEEPHDLHHRISVSNYGGAYFIWDRLQGSYRDARAWVKTVFEPAARQGKDTAGQLDANTRTEEEGVVGFWNQRPLHESQVPLTPRPDQVRDTKKSA